MARNPRGWNACMLAQKSSTVSRGIVFENIVGSNAATNAFGAPLAKVSACRRRCSATSGGSEPAQPAYADARIEALDMAACRRWGARARMPPNDSPATHAVSSPNCSRKPARQSA